MRHFVFLIVLHLSTMGVTGLFAEDSPTITRESRTESAMELKNDYASYVVGVDGRNLHFIDLNTGVDHLAKDPVSHFAAVKVGGREHQARSASFSGELLTVGFGEIGVTAVFRAKAEKSYFTFEVVSVTGDGVEEISFPNMRLNPGDFVGCALALNLETRVIELPKPQTDLRALGFRKFGLTGAKTAIIGCPKERLRGVMQDAVTAAPDLPKSPLGGPWALDAPINRGSYLFNFNGITEETADDWIRLAKSLGINQIDFHGGHSFRFGDCRPNPSIYPNGRKDLKAAIDKLHAAGITAGLHPYAFFVALDTPWVTPVPDPGLGKDATFTLAEDLSADASTVPTVESMEKMSTTIGFFVRNSITIQIGDELITYSGLSKEPPYAFTSCTRGAHGTKAVPHEKGAQVHHLKQVFGLFTPDGDSPMLADVAAHVADTFNECGFDMIYLDALDGADALGEPEFWWHYAPKFVFEIWKRLDRPALQEMSTFSHHLWYVRSRNGAWDHPERGHKTFIDIHCKANEENDRIFLPSHLGWWAMKPVAGPDRERTYPDDIEYLCAKAAGTECGLSIMGVDPDNVKSNSALSSLASIIKKWEDLRHAGFFTESMKEQLRQPGRDFTLIARDGGEPEVSPVDYSQHRYEGLDERTHAWTVENRFASQPAGIRIEALWSAGPYDGDAVILADFADDKSLPSLSNSPGMTCALESSSDVVKVGTVSGSLRFARSDESSGGGESAGFSATEHGVRAVPAGACGWSSMGKTFSPAIDLGERKAIGVWIHGDGQGEVLNFQMRSPSHVSTGIFDHYVTVDFTGWRYFELIEPESGRSEQYCWPYSSHAYAMYRELVDYRQVESFSVWCTNVPTGGDAKVYLSPVKALPAVPNRIINPRLTIGGKTMEFPVEIPSGGYLEYHSGNDCKLYGPDGTFVADVTPVAAGLELAKGENRISFSCGESAGLSARAKVTLISRGEPIK